MSNLSNYKKVQIVLLVMIVIAIIVFAMSIVKYNNIKNYATEATFSEMTDVAEGEIDETPDEEQNADMNDEDTSWDEDAEDTEVTEEEKENKDTSFPYYIKINYTANCITVYQKDSSGNYTVPVKAIVCSTGTATPRSGVYKMSQKYRWHELNGNLYGQYCSRITGHILFHSVPYTKASPDSLKYTYYDKLGTKASAGCIRLTTADAIWIYNNCPIGTMVEFYGSSNPGPLGKPSAKKISSNVQCRNWDPTDPDSRNPWHTYKEPAPSTNQSSGNNAGAGENTGTVEPPKQPSSGEQNNTSSSSGETKPDNTTGGNTNTGGSQTEPDNNTSGGGTSKPDDSETNTTPNPNPEGNNSSTSDGNTNT